MGERSVNGRVIVTVGRVAKLFGRSEMTIVRYWEANKIEGFKGTNNWLYLYWDSALKLYNEELKNTAP
jgi:hypothetical protein